MKKLGMVLLLAALPVSLAAQARAIHLVKGSWGDASFKVPAQFSPVADSTLKITLKESCVVQLSWTAEVSTGAPNINPVESGVQFKLYINGTAIDRVRTSAGSWGSSTSTSVLNFAQQFPPGEYTIEVRGKGSSRFPSFVLNRYLTLTAFRASQVDGL